jgi:hypothetical protein
MSKIVFDKVEIFYWYTPQKSIVSNFLPLLNHNHLSLGIYGNDFYCIGCIVKGKIITSNKTPLKDSNIILKTRFDNTITYLN